MGSGSHGNLQENRRRVTERQTRKTTGAMRQKASKRMQAGTSKHGNETRSGSGYIASKPIMADAMTRRELERELTALRADKVNLTAIVDKMTMEAKSAGKTLAANEKQIADLAAERDTARQAVEAFGNKNEELTAANADLRKAIRVGEEAPAK